MNIKHRSEYKKFIDYLSYFFIIIFLIRFIGEISSGYNYNSDIKIVFTDKNSNIFNKCLLDKNSRYKIDKNFIINTNKINAFIAK